MATMEVISKADYLLKHVGPLEFPRHTISGDVEVERTNSTLLALLKAFTKDEQPNNSVSSLGPQANPQPTVHFKDARRT